MVCQWAHNEELVTEIDFFDILSWMTALYTDERRDVYYLVLTLLEFSMTSPAFMEHKASTTTIAAVIIALYHFDLHEEMEQVLALEQGCLAVVSKCMEQLVDCYYNNEQALNSRELTKRRYPSVSSLELRTVNLDEYNN